MYTRHIIQIFNIICILKFTFKLTIMSWKFSFSVFKTHILDLIYFIFIEFRLNIFLFFLLITYVLILMHQDFIQCTVKKINITLLPVKFPSWYGIASTVLSGSTFNILWTKISQDLAFIWWMPGAMNDTDFWLYLWLVYIYISVLARALTLLGVGMWWGGFSCFLHDETSTGGIRPSRFFIRRFYYTFIDRLRNFHVFKYINWFLKSNRLTVKCLHIRLLAPDILHTI